jgi:hypothetical protein
MAADLAAALAGRGLRPTTRPRGTRWRCAGCCTARPPCPRCGSCEGTWRREAGALRALLLLTGQAGIGCEATFAGSAYAAGRMAAANREFDQLSTMATALLNKVS